MKKYTRWICFILICLNITPEIYTEAVEEPLPEHKLEKMFTDSMEGINYEDLEKLPFDRLNSIVQRLTNPQEVYGSRSIPSCPVAISIQLSVCTKLCKSEALCMINELTKFKSACKSGIKQTCGPSKACSPPCSINGKCVKGDCVCDPGYTGPTCGIKKPVEPECFPPCVKGKCVNDQCMCDASYIGPRCDERTSCHVPVTCGIPNTATTRRTKGGPTKGSQNRGRPSKPSRARQSISQGNRSSTLKSRGKRSSNLKRKSFSKEEKPKPSRIVHGKKVKPKRKYPWQVALIFHNDVPYKDGTIIGCGGSIINSRWILTAAHCMFEYWTGHKLNPSEVIPRVGEHDQSMSIDDDLINTRNYDVAEIIVHPGYDSKKPEFPLTERYNNDVALLRLNRDIPFNSVIKPICLPENDKEGYAGLQATVSGWGKTKPKDPYSSSFILREAVLKIHDNSDCYEGYGTVPPTQLCAGPTNGKAECNGDSGGPLVVKEGSKRIQVGVVSYSEKPDGCGSLPNSGVYARVSEYLDWIKATIGSCVINA